MASDSVSGTLSSLSCRNQDDFDMFAQTRSNSLAEQRKKYVLLEKFSAFFQGEVTSLFFIHSSSVPAYSSLGSFPWWLQTGDQNLNSNQIEAEWLLSSLNNHKSHKILFFSNLD